MILAKYHLESKCIIYIPAGLIPPVDAVPNPRAARLAKGLVRCLPN